jgi:hypothetical protein
MHTQSVPTPAAVQCRLKLTDEIRRHAAGARTKGGGYSARVNHAVACGKALLFLRELLEPGAWNRWIQQECGLTRMAANRYSRLARRADCLTPSMTLRQAYIAAGVIAPKKPQAEAPPDARLQ